MGAGASAEQPGGGAQPERNTAPPPPPPAPPQRGGRQEGFADEAPPSGGPKRDSVGSQDDVEEWNREKARLTQQLQEKKKAEQAAQEAARRQQEENQRKQLAQEEAMRRQQEEAAQKQQQQQQQQASPTNNTTSGISGSDASGDVGPDGKKKKKLLNGTRIEYKYPSGSTYVGGFKDGKLHGFGKYHYHPSNDEYEGEWLMDQKHGQGTYTYEGGDKYTGEWRNGKKFGKGTYIFATGDEYIGSWKEDKIHGYGVFTIARNGNRYEGNWEESYRHGQGTLKSGTGDVYTGLWVKGKEEGLGVLKYANGNIYAGDWRGGQMDGKGILKEGPQKFTVEHIAGYIISKVPVEADAEVDPDWNNANQLYRRTVGNDLNGSAAIGKQGSAIAGSASMANMVSMADFQAQESQLTKLKLERDMFEKKYKDLLAAKAGAGSEDKDTRNVQDVAELKRRIEELREQRDAEKQRADDMTARERVLKAEIDELNFTAENLRNELAAKKYNTGSGDEVERLQRRCAELEKELATRKQGAGSPSGGPRDDPVELRVKLELAEGELKNLRATREECRKLREQNLDNQRTMQGLEARNEELVKEMNLQRARATHLQGQISDSTAQNQQQLEQEAQQLRTELAEAQQKVAASDEKSKKQKKMLEQYEAKARRADDLEAEVLRLNRMKVGETELGKNLDKKMDQLDSLRKQNAELQRQLEEMQVDGDTPAPKKKGKKAKGGQDDDEAQAPAGGALSGDAAALIEQLQSDLKKEKKKHKKASQDRDAIAQELYEEQLKRARVERTLENMRGRINVIAKIRPLTGAEKRDGCDVAVSVNPDDVSQVLVNDQGEKTLPFQFDTALPAEAGPKEVIDEVKGTMADVPDGYHSALVFAGPIGSGKSTLVGEMLPGVAEELFTQLSLRHSANTVVSVKVTVVEASSDGVFDLSSGSEVLYIMHDPCDLVVPTGAVPTACASAADAVTKVKACLSRRRKGQSKRSHIWIQFATEVKHKVLQTRVLGHLTLVDLAGSGPLSVQEDDVESGKYVNGTTTKLAALVDALHHESQAVPYLDTKLNTLLSDIFGGNAFTTVVACLPPTSEQVNDSLQTLQFAQNARTVVNRPIVQQFVSVEEMRLREVVAQHASEGDAQPQLREVSTVRQS